MSADNYVYIQQDGKHLASDKWRGYMEFASMSRPLLLDWLFTTDSLRDAMEQAQTYKTEYGYMVVKRRTKNECVT